MTQSPDGAPRPSSRRALRIALVAGVVSAVTVLLSLDLGHWLSFETLKAQRAALLGEVALHPVTAAFAFFGLYVLTAALAIPGAVVLTLAGGALFGLVEGLVLVSFGSSMGATLAFLGARFLFRDAVASRLGARLAAIDAGIAREGAWYLLSLRLIPLFPFFLVNLALGLTAMRPWTFYWVSQLGMLPVTVLCVYAGTALAELDSLQDIASPDLWAALALIGVLPLTSRAVARRLTARRAMAPWRHLKPRRFDRNLIVIGGGAAGLVSSYIAAALHARVTLIERAAMGGECLNQGCVPSKALLHSAQLAAAVREARAVGMVNAPPQIDFGAVMTRVREAIAAIAPHDSVARYTELGVECLHGTARLIDPWRVEIAHAAGGTQVLSAHDIVLATGSVPRLPALPGLASVPCVTSETLWELETLPPRLLVLGGGPMGCELAQAFSRLGSAVTLLQHGPRLLPREDLEVAEAVTAALRADGVTVCADTQAEAAEQGPHGPRLRVRHGNDVRYIEFDQLLVAVGRTVRTEGLGLEALGITVSAGIDVDDTLATRHPHIHVAGDAVGGLQYTHLAAHQAWYATVNALFGRWKRFSVDATVIPSTVFVDPEVASVGLNESSAAANGIDFEITRYPLAELDRAIIDKQTRGFIKILTVPGRDRILGVTIVGAHASEMLAEFTLAMRHGLGLKRILATVHAYPSYAEAARLAAGAWRRAHVPAGLAGLLTRYHEWRRG